MTTFEPGRSLPRIRGLRDVLSRRRSPAATRDARSQVFAGPPQRLPLYEALAIGLGCNLGSLEHYTRRADAQAAGSRGDVR